jgi:hypothetical protein
MVLGQSKILDSGDKLRKDIGFWFTVHEALLSYKVYGGFVDQTIKKLTEEPPQRVMKTTQLHRVLIYLRSVSKYYHPPRVVKMSSRKSI